MEFVLIALELIKPYSIQTFLSFSLLSVIATLTVVVLGSLLNCFFEYIGKEAFGVSPDISITAGWILIGFILAINQVLPQYVNPFELSTFLKLLYDVGTSSYSFNVLASPILYIIGNTTLNLLGAG